MATGPLLETRACRFVRDPRGFVRATIKPGISLDLQDAQEAIAATWRAAGEVRCRVLVDLRDIRSETRDARRYFVGEEATRVYFAVALVIGSPVSRVVGNFFLRLEEHRTPTRLFGDDVSAVHWLLDIPGPP